MMIVILIVFYIIIRQWLQNHRWIFKFEMLYYSTISCNVIVMHEENVEAFVET